ncbi:MAG: TauD/TfdA family dioxygenase [Burkholderiales bacterium]
MNTATAPSALGKTDLPYARRRPVTVPSAWTARELAADPSWIYELTAAEIAELERAMLQVKRSGIPKYEVRSGDFPLPTLAPRLAAMWAQLEEGRGIALMRGVPVGRYDLDDVERLYWGIMAYFGLVIPQNTRGDLLGHVHDSGNKWGERKNGELVRGYLTNALLPFHTDTADIVSLMCVQKSKSGGLSSIVSSMAIFNAILRDEPDVLDTLFRGFHYSLRGEGNGGVTEVSSHRVPVFSEYDGKLSGRYIRKTIETASRVGGVELTPDDLRALAVVDRYTVDPVLRFDMAFEPGDIQILSNWTTFHSRTEFEDYDEPALKRRLLRLWQQAPQGRALAPPLRSPFGIKSPFLTREQVMALEGMAVEA